jgi:3-phytase
MKTFSISIAASLGAILLACSAKAPVSDDLVDEKITPRVITSPVEFDTDDPAIWIHPDDPSQSLIVGTDKEDGGGLYLFNLKGEIIRSFTPMGRPNNVDIAYGFVLQGDTLDIAVATERSANAIRVFTLPDLTPIDNGGIPVFEGEELRAPMGISLYTDPGNGQISAIVGRKEGPMEGYLWQYLLTSEGDHVSGKKVREFGKYSGKKEIEAIAVDNELGYVYYSDETHGIRKYYANPDSSGVELALFGSDGFERDHEGISIYKLDDKTGYILVSDQQAQRFRVFPREGTEGNPHNHPLITALALSTNESDGSDVYSGYLGPDFPQGIFVAMSDNKTFQIYAWEDLAGDVLKIRPNQ